MELAIFIVGRSIYVVAVCKCKSSQSWRGGGGDCRWSTNERSLKIHPAVTGPPFGPSIGGTISKIGTIHNIIIFSSLYSLKSFFSISTVLSCKFEINLNVPKFILSGPFLKFKIKFC
jgi:hypothetical protein